MYALKPCLGRVCWVNLSGGQFDKESNLLIPKFISRNVSKGNKDAQNVIALFGIATELIIPPKRETI